MCHRIVTKFERYLVILEKRAYKYKNEGDINTLKHLREMSINKIDLDRAKVVKFREPFTTIFLRY
jgi:hypothetical protein